MNQRIRKKLSARTGASITIALLLFLVCGVLCSVILTAGSAAAGRMSQVPESDQRYYAVTSAAELLQELIDGKTVSIVEVRETCWTTAYSGGVAGTPEEESVVTRQYLVADLAPGEIDELDLTEENRVENLRTDSFTLDAAKAVCLRTTVTDRELALRSSFWAASGLDYDALAVTLRENVAADGSIRFALWNSYKGPEAESDPGTRFTLRLAFTAHQTVTDGARTEILSSTAGAGDTYTTASRTTQTTITTLVWTLDEIGTEP